MAPNARVLVVDDERLIRWSLRERLTQEGYAVFEADSGRTAIEQFRQGIDLVVLDYGLPDYDGLELLQTLRDQDPEAVVIILTGLSSVERAVECMKHGAYHYATKPFSLDELSNLIARALEATELRRELRDLRTRTEASGGIEQILGESPPMKEAKTLLRRVAESPASTVLLTGESGTGKDLGARAIHHHSHRSHRLFMNITCSALTDTLLESELFGHERGAFTDAKQQKPGLLEQAEGGTVFLDEVAEMTPPLQAKLLRFLEEKAFRRVGGSVDVKPDVRVVAATNRDLRKDVREGRFREDLYYRLAVLHVHFPALRERGDDIELLAKYYVAEFNREFHKAVAGIAPEVLRSLKRHVWPGNVRELKNAVERAMLLTDGPVLRGDALGLADDTTPASFRLPPGGLDLGQLERELVVQALERAQGNQTRAAKLLGLNRDQIRYRIAKFELDHVRSVRGRA